MKPLLKNLIEIVVLCFMLSHCSKASRDNARPQQPKAEQGRELTSAPSLSPSKAGGGVIEGNGGEHITNEHNPWFLGEAAVLYCVRNDPASFSLGADKARPIIEKALATWVDLVKSRSPESLKAPFLLEKTGIRGLALNFREVGCSEEHELEFLLGVKDPDLDEALKFRAKDTIALSFREQYSDAGGRAKGRIWFSQDLGESRYGGPNPGEGFWALQHNLFNVLMHELGHVFGVRHLTSGFMAADFPSKILEFGMSSAVTKDSFDINVTSCGSFSRSLFGFRDPEALISKLFGLDIETVAQVCLAYNTSADPKKFSHLNGDFYNLNFQMKDGTSKTFEGIFREISSFGSDVSGRFLVEADAGVIQYAPFHFFNIYGPTIGRGVQETVKGKLFVAVESNLPGTLIFDFAIDGYWEKFVLIKDKPEVQDMLRLALPKE